MAKRKTTIGLLGVLSVVLIVGGWWTYNTLKPIERTEFEIEQGAKKLYVYRIQDIAIENIRNFLDTKNYPGSIFEDLKAKPQFENLQDIEIEINLEGVGNTRPFYDQQFGGAGEGTIEE